MSTVEVCIVGGGPAGLTAGIYTARAGLDTRVLTTGESILRRNAHLENVPGFPAGVDSRLFLELLTDQATRNGCTVTETTVTDLERRVDTLAVEHAAGTVEAEYVICASWGDQGYLAGVDPSTTTRGSKTFLDTTPDGETDIEGLYAAGRVAGQPHQTVVAAGHGARVGLAVVRDSPVPFYHDWVTPEGYFTDRGRDIPPGCEEIDEAERRRRDRESRALMREYFADPHPDEPATHPSLREE
jgi:thioredoxin reductase (NADPH)